MLNFTVKKPSRPPPPPPPPDTRLQHRSLASARSQHGASSSWATGSSKISYPVVNGSRSTMSNLTSSMRSRNEKALPPRPTSSLLTSSMKKTSNGSVMMEGSSQLYIPISECHTGPPPKPEKPLKFSIKQQQLKNLEVPVTGSEAAKLVNGNAKHHQNQQMQPGYFTTNNRKTLSTSISSVKPTNQCSSATLHQKSQSCGVEGSQSIQYLSLYMELDKLSFNDKKDHSPQQQKKPLPRQISPPSMQSTVYRQVDFVKTEALTKCKVERTCQQLAHG